MQSHSQVASATNNNLAGETEVPSARDTEKAVLQLCITRLHVNLSSRDISTAHPPEASSGTEERLIRDCTFRDTKSSRLGLPVKTRVEEAAERQSIYQ